MESTKPVFAVEAKRGGIVHNPDGSLSLTKSTALFGTVVGLSAYVAGIVMACVPGGIAAAGVLFAAGGSVLGITHGARQIGNANRARYAEAAAYDAR